MCVTVQLPLRMLSKIRVMERSHTQSGQNFPSEATGVSRGIYQVSLNTCETLSAGMWWDANGPELSLGNRVLPVDDRCGDGPIG